MDTDTVDYPFGTQVWVMRPGRKLTTGVVVGHAKSGKPLVQRAGVTVPAPVSKMYLSKRGD